MAERAQRGDADPAPPLRGIDPVLAPQALEVQDPDFGVESTVVVRLALLDSVFALALVAARLAYHGHVHPIVYVAVAVVLAVYAAGAAQALRMTVWQPERRADFERAWRQGLDRIDRLAARCPKVAMAGTVTGFLIAFGGPTNDVEQRVRGASTGLIATLIGIVAMLLLELQHDWLSERHETH